MGDQKLEWMYRNSNEVVDSEEYLLGKAIDKAFEQTSSRNDIEKDCLPTSIFSCTSSNIQVDVVRKIKEDPLEIIRQQEIERRKQLLKNPVKLKKLQNLLKAKEGGVVEVKKSTSSAVSYVEDSQEIDRLLISKYQSLMKKHGIKSLRELSSLKIKKKKTKKAHKQESKHEDSDETSSENEAKDKKVSRHRKSSDSDSSNSQNNYSHSKKVQNKIKKYKSDSDEEHTSKGRSSNELKRRDEAKYSKGGSRYDQPHMQRSRPNSKYQKGSSEDVGRRDDHGRRRDDHGRRRDDHGRRREGRGLSEEARQRKLEEMMDNAKWRDEVRVQNVARYKKEDASENQQKEYNEDFLRNQMAIATSSGSVESRIKSNINNIQRSKFSMDQNFARR